MPKRESIYDLVYRIMKASEGSRNSDKKLIWNVLYSLGLCTTNYIAVEDYINAPSSESITRAARKVRELHPELRPTLKIEKIKKAKEATRGNFIFDRLFK